MTNLACIGYAIMAAKAVGLSKATIDKLEAALYELMDGFTEYEAEHTAKKEA